MTGAHAAFGFPDVPFGVVVPLRSALFRSVLPPSVVCDEPGGGVTFAGEDEGEGRNHEAPDEPPGEAKPIELVPVNFVVINRDETGDECCVVGRTVVFRLRKDLNQPTHPEI